MQIRKAVRQKAKLRLGIAAPSGAGKTYSSLLLAMGLGGKIGLIDTESGSGDLYAHLGDYDIIPITAPYTAAKYREAIKAFEQAGYSVIIVDSLSHAWAGEGGLLDKQGKIADGGGNGFAAWRKVTPDHNALVEAMLQSPCHIIATMRSKQEYVLEKDDKGKMAPKKVGMAPVQREGMEYEFTVCFDMDVEHNAHATKDRTSLFDGLYFKITQDTGKKLLAWLEQGIEPITPASVAQAPAAQQTQTQPATPAPQPAPAKEAATNNKVEGELTQVKAKTTADGVKHGLKLASDERWFTTFAALAANNAKKLVGKRISITYQEKQTTAGISYEMIGFKEAAEKEAATA